MNIPKPIKKLPNKVILDYIFKLGELNYLIKNNMRFKRKLNEIKKLKIGHDFSRKMLVDCFVNNNFDVNYILNMINRIVGYETELIIN